ncbi:MAG: hypothetical protein HRT44_12350 [Bdellovibrionales bacterium]|nr:hypothetical protein [Bdellovibrionales bacterium]NQZ20029.1 hypothetical protein [Bdellovibrionales bacterium]
MESHKEVANELTPHQENYLEVENHCCLCGTELIFEHVPSEESENVIEKAHCPCCNIQLKDKEHIVH